MGLARLPRSNAQPRVGELRRHALLESSATYRVIANDGDIVIVEVVEAPGLNRGARVRFSAEAVVEMTVLPASGAVESRGHEPRPS